MDSKSKHISGEQPEILQPFSVYTHLHASPTKGLAMNQPKINSLSFVTHLFLLLFLLNTTTGNLIYDRQALLEFSHTVPHGRKLNWDLTTPICTSWVGVTCTTDGTRVLALRLPGIGLSGPIPAQTLGKLDALRILSLRSNGLSGSLPSDIFTLPSLHYLFLQHNNFSGDIPDSLSPDLNVLDLSFNWLTGNIPDINLPKLRHLNLSNNNLNGSVPCSLRRFPNSSFTGNLHLCLCKCSPVIPSPSPSPSSLPPPAIFPLLLLLLILLVLLISVCCFRKKLRESKNIHTKKHGSRNLEVTYTHKEEHGGILTLCGHYEQAKPVLLCACNDNTVRLYDLPSFNDRGKIFAKEEIPEIQIGPRGIFFTDNANGELKVGSGGQNQPQLASWDAAQFLEA